MPKMKTHRGAARETQPDGGGAVEEKEEEKDAACDHHCERADEEQTLV